MSNKHIKALGDNLLYLMGAEDYTIKEAAEKFGISKRKLCEIIYAEPKDIRFNTIERISENVKIPVSTLIGEGERGCCTSMSEADRLHKEIDRLLSVIDEIWILNQIARFIKNMTKGTKYE